MAKYKFTSSLSVDGINNLISQLNNYKSDLHRRTDLFINRLADYGISIAQMSAQGDSHHFDSMVVFEKKSNGKAIRIIGRNDNTSGLHIGWYDADANYHDEVISPILMLEYGSAGLAVLGHQGTFAVTGTQVDNYSWYYATELDENGNPTGWKYATAEEPHYPMYLAFIEMKNQINTIAKEVFK